MPLYIYRCKKCGYPKERKKPLGQRYREECKSCGYETVFELTDIKGRG